jgi:hypothetical protein
MAPPSGAMARDDETAPADALSWRDDGRIRAVGGGRVPSESARSNDLLRALGRLVRRLRQRRLATPPLAGTLHGDARGAAMVEFVVILVPLMTLFLSMIELSRLAIAHLLLERAAGMAVRACAVIKDQPKNCGAEGESADELIRLAADEGLRPWTDTNLVVDELDCRTQKPSGEDMLRIRAQFRCVVPIARDIVCRTPNQGGGAVASRSIDATARYAHQGASYDCNYANMEYAVPGASGPLDLPDLGGAWP